jgi:thioredoxin 1
MKKQNVLLSLAFLLPGCFNASLEDSKTTASTEQNNPIGITVEEITQFKDLKEHDKAIVKFSTEWCGACKVSAEPYAHMIEKYPDVKFFSVDLEKDGDIKDKFEIQGVPTFIIFEKGQDKEKILGFNEEKIHEKLKELTAEKKDTVQPTKEVQIIKIKDKKEFEKAIKDNKKTIVKFYGDWCGFCKMIAPDYEELSKEYGDKVKFLEVEITDNQDLATEHNIKGVPMFASFEDGIKKETVSGANKDALKKTVKTLAQ